jgi:hypothetical protein
MNKRMLTLCAAFMITACSDKEDFVENSVLVFKYKGSVQCDFESGIPLENMESELTDISINVLCASEASDGNVAAALCGAGTGVINVYEIPISSLVEAKNLGFDNVQLLENANIVMDCE